METIQAPSVNTELNDRVLWYDGDSTITADSLLRALVNGKTTKGLYVDEVTPDIVRYNINVSKKEERIGVKEGLNPLSYDWNMPDEYKNIDVMEYVIDKLVTKTKNLPDADARAARCAHELEMYRKLELMDVLRTLIYIINTLIENNVVWGVGRGSSVSSYVLYLIGVHDVDSFKYGLNIEEFLRTE